MDDRVRMAAVAMEGAGAVAVAVEAVVAKCVSTLVEMGCLWRNLPPGVSFLQSGGNDDAAPDSLLEMAAEMERTARPDLIGDLFKVGALDPARLPGHPCPPGKDDGSMRSNLLPFQVRLSPQLAYAVAILTIRPFTL